MEIQGLNKKKIGSFESKTYKSIWVVKELNGFNTSLNVRLVDTRKYENGTNIIEHYNNIIEHLLCRNAMECNCNVNTITNNGSNLANKWQDLLTGCNPNCNLGMTRKRRRRPGSSSRWSGGS